MAGLFRDLYTPEGNDTSIHVAVISVAESAGVSEAEIEPIDSMSADFDRLILDSNALKKLIGTQERYNGLISGGEQ